MFNSSLSHKMPVTVAALGVALLAGCDRPPVSEAPTSPPRVDVEPTGSGQEQGEEAALEEDHQSQTVPVIEYSVRNEPAGETGAPATSIVALRDGETVVVVPPTEDACFTVVAQQDLDGDGLVDALLENALSCGGNLAPAHFLYVSGTRGDRFEVQELDSQWEQPTVHLWQGRPSIVIETNNEGMNLASPQKVTRRFVFEKGKAVIAEETRAVELDALVDLRAEQFEVAGVDEEKRLSFDLDGNGKTDQLVGKLWARWGRINWHVLFDDGRVANGDFPACKRIGVLQQKTKGHHDLVCDFDTRFQWNGQTYESSLQQ